ncbi:MAG: protein translocase subunit SecF [Pseudomonadales bacterium]|nr:protein translocase subunit SecF [Pseudomonadales bacterium]
MSAQQHDFDFLRIGTAAFVISTILVLGSLASIAVKGLNLGLDFTGGTLLELGFTDAVALTDVRAKLAEAGQPRASAVHFGTEREVLIRLPTADSPAVVPQIVGALDSLQQGSVTLRRTELVGPQMGEEMLSQGGLAVLSSFLCVMLYVSIRFQWKLSVGAVASLVHDVIITLGAFALFGWEIDLAVLAAFLALIGYSINDTIVVYDRIRENVRKMRRMEMLALVNASLNQTLGRTLMTSGVTLLSVIALLLFGGDTLRGFSLALTIGIVIGTYSSIYIAANSALRLGLDRADLMLPVAEKGEGHEAP